MAISNNYTGRSIDYFIFQNAKVLGRQLISLNLDSDNGGQICTGIQKVSQTFAILFLTRVGTVMADSSAGSTFMTRAQQGVFNTDSEVKTSFDMAAESIRQQMRASIVSSTPDDEKLARVELNSFNLDRGTSQLKLVATLTTDAGATRTIYLPVPTVIR